MRTKTNKHQKFVDYFSVGHYFKGLLTFFIIYVLLLKIGYDNGTATNCALGIAFLFALFWEIFENFAIPFLKIGKCEDSLKNSLLDIVFDIIGGLTGLIIIYLINILV